MRLSSSFSSSSSSSSSSPCSSCSVISDALVWPELREIRTLLEGDLGIWVGDAVLCLVGDEGEEAERSVSDDNIDDKGTASTTAKRTPRDVLIYVPGMM